MDEDRLKHANLESGQPMRDDTVGLPHLPSSESSVKYDDFFDNCVKISICSEDIVRRNGEVSFNIHAFIWFGEPMSPPKIDGYTMSVKEGRLRILIFNGGAPLGKIKVHRDYYGFMDVEGEHTHSTQDSESRQTTGEFGGNVMGFLGKIARMTNKARVLAIQTKTKTKRRATSAGYTGGHPDLPTWIFAPFDGQKALYGYFSAEPLLGVTGDLHHKSLSEKNVQDALNSFIVANPRKEPALDNNAAAKLHTAATGFGRNAAKLSKTWPVDACARFQVMLTDIEFDATNPKGAFRRWLDKDATTDKTLQAYFQSNKQRLHKKAAIKAVLGRWFGMADDMVILHHCFLDREEP